MDGYRSRGVRALVAGAAALAVLTATVGPARAASAAWRLPVDGGLVRPFVEPASRFGPGHRGVDFATAPGAVVRAAGRGTVVFAGDVAGARHVVVLHQGGVRTSYSYLLVVSVGVGDAVEAGAPVGQAGGADPDGLHADVLHFGVRVGERYVDPMLLFRPGDLAERVRLIPTVGEPGGGPSWERSPAGEAAGVLVGLSSPSAPGPSDGDGGCGSGIPLVGRAADLVCDGVDWASARTRDALRAGLAILRGAGRTGRTLAARLRPELEALLGALARGADDLVAAWRDQPVVRVLTDVVEIGTRFLEWTRRECSQHAPAADGTGGSGHAVMAVAGIDSSTAVAGGRSFDLDVHALGYRADEVHWFSYAADGGPYTADDTRGDLRIAAKRLAEQLRAREVAEPGREVDLIAHSQGGVVVERFLRFEYDASDPTFPPLGTVVTLAAPHRGAPLASTVHELRGDDRVGKVLGVADRVLPGPPSSARSVAQLAEDSPFMQRLHAAPLPEHLDVTTIGGSDDLVVPANRIRIPGATEVVVEVDGLSDHGAIDDDARAMQVVRSALERRPPPCTSVLEGLRAAVAPVLISRVEGDLGEYLTTYLEVRTWK